MSRIRQFHLYLGCIFAPVLIFFAVSGAWQTFRWDHTKKDGSYQAPQILKSLSVIHKDQAYPFVEGKLKPSIPFRYFVLVMSLGLVATTLLGIFMAFKFARARWIVWVCLILGFILPALLLYIGGSGR